MNISSHSNIFLEKSYQDMWSDYQYSLSSARATVWSWVIITASNEKQAEAYQMQIDERVKNKFLPKHTKYVVIADPDGKRVGSGGATLNVLRYISANSDATIKNPLDCKMLVIHSGGDSKRIPQYSACGKLFSPMPKLLPDGRRSTLFDELIISVASLPSQMNNGMLVMSGDALLLFNSLQIDLKLSRGAVALSTREAAETGVNHGVFLCNNEKKYVSRFLHKQSKDTLEKIGSSDDSGCVDLDTGAVWLESGILNDLVTLISDNKVVDNKKFDAFVNENVRLSFYGDFLYPLADSSTYDEYMGVEGEVPLNDELLNCRKQLWGVLQKYKLSIIRMSPAKFIHFGTTRELYDLVTSKIGQYDFLNWNGNVLTNVATDRYAINNSFINKNAHIGNNCYIEDCYIGDDVTIGDNVILSNINLKSICIPSDVVIHGLKLESGSYVARIYGIRDNPKKSIDGSFLSSTLGDFVSKSGIVAEKSLWNTDMYPICNTVDEAVKMSLIIYKISNGIVSDEEMQKWRTATKISLEEGFQKADIRSIFEYRKNIENAIRAEQFAQALENRTDIKEAITILSGGDDIIGQLRILFDKATEYNYTIKMRIYLALSYVLRERDICLMDMDYQQLEDMCYDVLNDEINSAMRKIMPTPEKSLKFMKDEVVVELPVRVNLGGGWSDTPPYSLENGGAVLNAAVSLNGKQPIKVTIKKLAEKIVRLESIDLDYKQEFTDISQLLNYSNLSDSFVIIKAAFVLTGVISLNDKSLDDVFDRLGGGVYMSISADVPKGSGLGTSSILAGGCIKAISEIFGLNYDIDTIYSQVLCLEQLMKTGGGWQDQVGGLTNGIKLTKSRPGIVQKLNIEYVNMTEDAMREFKERYALVYSGQQRLAKNILREIMNKYILSDERVVDILCEIQRIAVLMKFELEKGNITAFAELLNQHLELSKQLDKGSTNTCIDQIFDVCDDLIDGKCICGAGGGGFLQMILKKGVTKDDLRKRLNEVFGNSGIEVWDCEFV